MFISDIVVAKRSVLVDFSLVSDCILSFSFLNSALGVLDVDTVVNSESCFLVWSIDLSIDPISFFRVVLAFVLSLKLSLSLESVICEFTFTTLKSSGETIGEEGVCPYIAGITFSLAAAINILPKSDTCEL